MIALDYDLRSHTYRLLTWCTTMLSPVSASRFTM